MSPILDDFERPPRPPRVGRIRGGVFEEGRTGKGGHPKATETIVLTSDSRIWLDRLQAEYGGKVEDYTPQGQTQPIWRLVTETDSLMVLLPFPRIEENFEEWYELWAASGLERRCDGYNAQVAGWDDVEENVRYDAQSCVCKAQGGKRACSVIWRLSVWLPQTGLGVWQLQSSSKHARIAVDGSLKLLEKTFPDMLNRIPVRLAYSPQVIAYPDPKERRRRKGTKRIWSLSLGVPVADAARILAAGGSPIAALQGAMRGTTKELPSGQGSTDQGSPAIAEPPAEGRPAGRGAHQSTEQGAEAPTRPAGTNTPWARYEQAVKALAAATKLDERGVRRTYCAPWCVARKAGFPPKKDWPEEQLVAIAEHLEQAAEAAGQLEMDVATT